MAKKPLGEHDYRPGAAPLPVETIDPTDTPIPLWANLWSVLPPKDPPTPRHPHIYDFYGWPQPPLALGDLMHVAAWIRAWEGQPISEREQRMLYMARGLLATATMMGWIAEHLRRKVPGAEIRDIRSARSARPAAKGPTRPDPRREQAVFKRARR